MKNLSWLGQVLIVTEQTTTKIDAEIQAACYQSSCLLVEVFGCHLGCSNGGSGQLNYWKICSQ